VKKSVSLRIGVRFNRPCSPFNLNEGVICSVKSLRYLGVFIKAGMSFNCDFAHTRLAFYRAFNSIYANSCMAASEMITVALLRAICLPILFYSLEAVAPSRSALRSLDNLIDNAVWKTFKVSSGNSILYIRNMIGLRDIFITHSLSVCRFTLQINKWPSILKGAVFKLACRDLHPWFNMYDIDARLPIGQRVGQLSRLLSASV